MEQKKLKELNLNQKIELLNFLNLKNSERAAAAKFGASKGTVSNIKNRAEEYQKQYYEDGFAHDRKRKLIKTEYEEVNNLTQQWFLKARACNIPLSGPILKEVAKQFAAHLKKDDFTASDGWIHGFKKRNQIAFKVLSGEEGSCNETEAQAFKSKVSNYCEGYSPEQIYNADETALFFRSIPKKSLVQKYKDSKGNKHCKEKITELFATNLVGDKQQPIVIGKFQNPRCFKNLNVKNLPVTYFSNKKAQISAKIFETWLKTWNDRLIKEKNKILLFIDNAACHPPIVFSNIKLQFLPPNLTALVQPLDQGIIHSFKSNYRKYLMRNLIAQVNQSNEQVNAQKISLLDSIFWIQEAWKDVTSNCIKNCFLKAGFQIQDQLFQQQQINNNNDLSEIFKKLKN